MHSDDLYEDMAEVRRNESFILQNNQSYSEDMEVQSAESETPVATKSRSYKLKYCILIICISVVFLLMVIVITVVFSVHNYQLKNRVLEVEKSQNNVTAALNDLANAKVKIEMLSESFKGHHPLYPASSCASTPSILNSGYYWIQSWNGSVVKVYCDMTRRCGNITGGWMRVALLDTRDNSAQCPPGLCLNSTLPRTCRKCDYRVNCSSDTFPVYVNYSNVCGRIIGYQIGSSDAFSMMYSNGLDGVKLSHRNPPEIIWTFAAAFAENFENVFAQTSLCPCINDSDLHIPEVPSEIGANYFCDTGARYHTGSSTFHTNDPLWDGAGCTGVNTCCSFNNPPWFYRELAESTEAIDMNLCTDEATDNEDIGLQLVEIYVQ